MSKNKPTIISVVGVDSSGKSTLIKSVCDAYPYIELMEFPKKAFGSKFKIDTPNELLIYTSFAKYLDSSKVFIQDRGIPCNLAYGTEFVDAQYDALKVLHENVNLHFVFIDKNPVDQDYSDDLISLTSQRYNEIIHHYRQLYNALSEYGFNCSKFLINKEPGVFDQTDAINHINNVAVNSLFIK